MSEHLERLLAMRDDEGLTWDLSGNDKAAFTWAIERIAELEASLEEWADLADVRLKLRAAEKSLSDLKSENERLNGLLSQHDKTIAACWEKTKEAREWGKDMWHRAMFRGRKLDRPPWEKP